MQITSTTISTFIYTTDVQIKDIFKRIKADEVDFFKDMSTLEFYYFIKAYKLVDRTNMSLYCDRHKGSLTQRSWFYTKLKDIFDEHYPPLEYCHEQGDGYIGINRYIDIAKQVF